MSPKPIKTYCDGTMTTSAWLAFVRSTLRSKSLRWPPRTNTLIAARRPYIGSKKLQKWEYQCALCQEWFPAKIGKKAHVVVDHYPKAAGSILKVEDISQFVENLFCDSSNLRVLCKPCHDVHTLAESRGISFQEAVVEKEIIAIMKLPVKELLDFLGKHGYSGASVSNKQKRFLLVEGILRGK